MPDNGEHWEDTRDNPWEKADRKRGILTKKDREYLLGEYQPTGQDRRNIRYRIRQRIKHALLDIQLLSSRIEYEELEQIVNNYGVGYHILIMDLLTFVYRIGDIELGPDEFTYDDEEMGYRVDEYFSRMLENGISRAIWYNTPFVDSSTDITEFEEQGRFSVDVDARVLIDRSQHDTEKIFQKLQEGTATEEEFEVWLKMGNPESLREYKRENDEPLKYIHPDLEKPVSIDIEPEDLARFDETSPK